MVNVKFTDFCVITGGSLFYFTAGITYVGDSLWPMKAIIYAQYALISTWLSMWKIGVW